MSQRLAEYLVEEGLLQADRVEHARRLLMDSRESPVAELIRLKEIDDEKLARWLSQQFSLPLVNLARVRIDDRARERIPSELLASTPCLPIGTVGDVTIIAIADPTLLPEIDAARSLISGSIEVVLTTFTALWAAYRAEITDSTFWNAFENIGDDTTRTEIG